MKKRHRTNPAVHSEVMCEEAKSAAALAESDAHVAELARRGSLLQAVGTGLTELLTADSVRVALHGVLERIAGIIRIDRMLVLQVFPLADGTSRPEIYYSWHRAGLDNLAGLAETLRDSPHRAAFFDWIAPLQRGAEVYASQLSAQPGLRQLLAGLGVVSQMLVPIMVRDKHWGTVGFDDCSGEHEWSPDEVRALKMLANLIGVAITRERSIEELRSRDELLHGVTLSANQIMTAPILHEAISSSLEKVAQSVRADRMFVLEVVPTENGGAPLLLHRNSWHRAQMPLELETMLRAASAPYADDYLSWTAPLAAGNAIDGSLRTAAGGLKEYFRRLKLQSTLIVPIMVDARYWGQIGFDACTSERGWTAAEIDILKMLAELIGTAIKRERYVEQLTNANTIVQNSPTILYRLRGEPSFPLMYISQNIALFGYDAAGLLDSPTVYRSYVYPEDSPRVHAAMAALLHPNAPPTTIEFRMSKRDGAVRWVENRYTPVRDSNGRLIEVEGILIDVTERKAAEERIAQLARTDALTGLANRATLNDRLKHAWASAQRGGRPFALLYLDLDRFKDVNDTLGHPVGDQLLQQVAGRLRQITRDNDLVARLGGDEFVVLQADTQDASAASTLATKIIEAVSEPYHVESNELRVGVSVGISLSSDAIADPDELLAHADQALYRAKEEGRGQYRFHTVELDAETHERVRLTEDLRLALECDQLELYYQPQVELSSRRVTGMEALIRWNHPTRGLLLPDTFLPIAEKTGLMLPLGRLVLDGACRQLSLWRKANMNVPVIAVNVGLAQVRAGREFVEDVKRTLLRWELSPRDLEIDVTELILARTTLAQSTVLEELHQLGVHIAIDDFGAQYSSLDYLRTYQVSRLKIPRRVVSAATSDRGGAALVRAIVGLASELDVEVIAEGVETEDQRDQLVKMSATKGQGYLFSTPMPAGEATEVLREQGLASSG